MVICGQLIDCLGLHLSVCCHVIIMQSFGPIRARLTFCSYPHVSMSSSSMLITVTRRCQCLQIWIQKFAILKQVNRSTAGNPSPSITMVWTLRLFNLFFLNDWIYHSAYTFDQVILVNSAKRVDFYPQIIPQNIRKQTHSPPQTATAPQVSFDFQQ